MQVAYEGGKSSTTGCYYGAGLVAFAEKEGALAGGEFDAVCVVITAGERRLLPHGNLGHVRGLSDLLSQAVNEVPRLYDSQRLLLHLRESPSIAIELRLCIQVVTPVRSVH